MHHHLLEDIIDKYWGYHVRSIVSTSYTKLSPNNPDMQDLSLSFNQHDDILTILFMPFGYEYFIIDTFM